jgi:predicted regulator of amino acid metabolism with ACT domain
MWADIEREFSDSPSQSRVIRFLLENGFGVNEEGRVVCNGIEIPATHIGKAIETDRRVVDATARRILGNTDLREIFTRMRVSPDLSHVAEALGLSVITLLPKDAHQKGIVGAAVKVLVDHDLSIRQIFVTDPYFAEEPKLVMIVDEKKVPATVYEHLRALPQVKQLII